MAKSISDLIARYRDLEQTLSKLFSTNSGPVEDELRTLDRQISTAFDEVIRSNLDHPSDNLDRLHFLVAQARKFVDSGGMLNSILNTILDDANALANSNAHYGGYSHTDDGDKIDELNELVELCYCSKACAPFSPYELHALCAQAGKKNREIDVTGVLTYDQKTDRFFQLLEGPTSAVAELMDLLYSDPRHRDVALIHHGNIARRAFAQWSMFLIMSSEIRSEISSDHEVNGWIAHRLSVEGDLERLDGLSHLSASLKSMLVRS